MIKATIRMVDPGPGFRMRRLWRSWCHVYGVTNRRAVCTFL